LALKALDAKAPNEVLAVAAEGGLLEEASDELVLFDDGDRFLAEGTATIELLGTCFELYEATVAALFRAVTAALLLVK